MVISEGCGERMIICNHEILLAELLALLQLKHICYGSKIISNMKVSSRLDSCQKDIALLQRILSLSQKQSHLQVQLGQLYNFLYNQMDHQFGCQQQTKVGITEYISKGRQVPAITKYLLSDFIVNEIDKNQQLVYLKSKPFVLPEEKKEQFNFELSQQLTKQIRQILGEEAAEGIAKLYDQLDCGEKISPWQIYIPKQLNKSQRMALHDFVRQKLYQIQSTTGDNGKIKLRFNKNLRKMNPNARHKYTYFKLYKYGIDTFNAIFRLSKATGINNKLFSTAGLKDKRGFTTQLVSVYNTDLPSLKKFYKQSDRNRQIWIDEFQECQENKIEVGGLFGNQFGLILRLLNSSDQSVLAERVQSLRDYGMINYFGLQRFGQFSIKTYELGALVVKKQWKELIQNILLSDCGNFNTNNLKREFYETKQYFKAQKLLHNRYKIQKLIFRGLEKQGENYFNVFQMLPRTIKSLYTHALQSYIWNKVVSRRIKQYGLKLVIGDLVGIKKNHQKHQVANVEEEEEGLQDLKQEVVQDDEQLQALLITQENINNYTIHDLVAPLYGPNSLIPQQSILYFYIQQELNQLGLKDQDFVKNSKLYCFKGQFRKIIVKPNKVDFKVIRHSHPKDDLLSPLYVLGEEMQFEQGQLRSLQLILQLPKSSYATMAIRQILHITSEFDIQMDLNRQYEKKYNLSKGEQGNK